MTTINYTTLVQQTIVPNLPDLTLYAAKRKWRQLMKDSWLNDIADDSNFKISSINGRPLKQKMRRGGTNVAVAVAVEFNPPPSDYTFDDEQFAAMFCGGSGGYQYAPISDVLMKIWQYEHHFRVIDAKLLINGGGVGGGC